MTTTTSSKYLRCDVLVFICNFLDKRNLIVKLALFSYKSIQDTLHKNSHQASLSIQGCSVLSPPAHRFVETSRDQGSLPEHPGTRRCHGTSGMQRGRIQAEGGILNVPLALAMGRPISHSHSRRPLCVC